MNIVAGSCRLPTTDALQFFGLNLHLTSSQGGRRLHRYATDAPKNRGDDAMIVSLLVDTPMASTTRLPQRPSATENHTPTRHAWVPEDFDPHADVTSLTSAIIVSSRETCVTKIPRGNEPGANAGEVHDPTRQYDGRMDHMPSSGEGVGVLHGSSRGPFPDSPRIRHMGTEWVRASKARNALQHTNGRLRVPPGRPLSHPGCICQDFAPFGA